MVIKSRAILRYLMILAFFVVIGSAYVLHCFFPNKLRNVLLISIDTCRSDYLSCYGYSRKTTPNIDRLAQEGFLFCNTYSPVPQTLPGHSSMLTGTIPPFHGVHDNNGYKLDQSNMTIAEIMHENHFKTGAIIGAFVLDSIFNLNQGFDYYNDHFKTDFHNPLNQERIGAEVNRLAIEWLNWHKKNKFFLFLHYFDPHADYEPPDPFAKKFQDNLYAGEIAYTDHCIGQIINELKNLGLYDSTLIVITSDHGEMLGEHGETNHSYFIYQSAIKVPLIFRLPSHLNGKKIEAPSSIIDIVPTILSSLDIKIPDQVQGKDLSIYFREKNPSIQNRFFYCESLLPTKYMANSLLGLVTDRWKYIQTTQPELYNIVKDPNESTNLIIQNPDVARRLKDSLKQILEESIRERKSDTEIKLDEKAKKALESLGYLARINVDEDFEFDQRKDDPKNLIDFHREVTKASHLIIEQEYEKAKMGYEKIIMERPQYWEAYLFLATIAEKQNDFAKALQYWDAMLRFQSESIEALRVKPDFAYVHNKQGLIHMQQGNIKEATRHFSEALRIEPTSSESYFFLGLALIKQGTFEKAKNNFLEVLRINPNFAEAYYNLALISLREGKTDEAIQNFSEALRINPNFEKAHIHLGITFSKTGRNKEAILHFQDALRINPKSANAQDNLNAVLAKEK